jgi:hypothetical protein
MVRWLFVIGATILFAGFLFAVNPAGAMTAHAFSAGGAEILWGYLITGLILYVGLRATK